MWVLNLQCGWVCYVFLKKKDVRKEKNEMVESYEAIKALFFLLTKGKLILISYYHIVAYRLDLHKPFKSVALGCHLIPSSLPNDYKKNKNYG